MNKKFAFVVLILAVFLVSYVSALDIKDIDVPSPYDLERDSKSYLVQEWENILQDKPFFGELINFYEKVVPILNPVSEIVFGLEVSLSLVFFLTLVFSVFILVFIYRVFYLYSFFSDFAKIGISLALSVVVIVLRVPKYFAEFLVGSALFVFDNIWLQIILLLIILVIMIYLIELSAKFAKLAMEEKKKREEEFEEMQEDFDREILHTTADSIRKGLGD